MHEQFQSKEINIVQTHTAWDYISLEISHCKPHSKKYIVSNVYRLPEGKVVDYTIFIEEFSSFLNDINSLKHPVFICDDFNINLLLIDDNQHFSCYFDNVLSKGFFPRITLPTRIDPPS